MPGTRKHGRSTGGSEPSYFVGIGASAGGLEALDAFFNHMPSKSGMAFIVIQHLSPDYKSLMVELLSKRTAMPVRRAEEGLRVQADTVYLIPPGKHLTIFHGKLILRDPDPNRGINLPIDVFFRSLAEDRNERSVGIILSGTGSDGVRGIRAIKEAGGLVMVQSQESAKFDGMPRAAIATGLADVVASPEDLPGKLVAFSERSGGVVGEAVETAAPDEDCLSRVFSILRDQTQVDFAFYKPSTVLRRLDRRLAFNHVTELRDYVGILESHPTEVQTLYRELLIGVTSFFRDREVFDELGRVHLPHFLETVPHREVRFWVAACSTGEEAYTLAILTQEILEQLKRSLQVKIFATDLDRDAILQAGNGQFPESIAADIPPKLLAKYFQRRDEHYQVNRAIREMVVFARHDLVRDPPFANIDLLSCRNVLIYLQPVLQHKVMDFLNFSLNPGGLLVLGTSETPGDMADYFEPLNHRLKIYRSRGRKRPPVDRLQFEPPAEHLAARSLPPRGGRALAQRDEERIIERLLQALAEESTLVAAVVNETLELRYVTGDAQGFLHVPMGKPHHDITRMVVGDLAIPLTTGLQKVFQTGTEIKYTNLRIPRQGEVKSCQLRIRPLPGRRGQEPMAAVLLQEMPSVGREAPIPGGTHEFDIGRETQQRIQDLEQELQFTKENLQATIEELETSNEELQATNEELLASNEELQSTNEELQSVNEELHTVNAEYQSKILELTEMTNDFDNLMAAVRIGALFLDENLEIRKFTSELSPKLFHLLESDIGRPLKHLTHNLDGVSPLTLVREVIDTDSPRELEVQIKDGGWVLLRILPYDVGGPQASGAVLTFTDITRLKESEALLRTSEQSFRNLANSGPALIWTSRTDKLCDWFNETWLEFTGRTLQEEYGTGWTEGVHPDDLAYCHSVYSDSFDRRIRFSMVYRLRRHDGEYRWIQDDGCPRYGEEGQFLGYIGYCLDVTDTHLREQTARIDLESRRAHEEPQTDQTPVSERRI